ncbi:DUF1183-domain-containing protein [Lentinus tigrinus ALCF2SS1-6]|uniref:Store-operated calcium entry-associated regulatory factor n=1 Tax=Lentinus tigrinus ALCF2SS1-6 TaxID=1328759 RepID=A0A5C2RVS0_9APHY|nr:DUF1183-domain-containing protein [Lentinus tigrinus ALCF2SS1-6]
MSRIALARIPSLTFYKDSVTASRRGNPIPQLSCIGKPCRLYQPEVVRCTNLGGTGTEVDWKCEADLPEALRLGRVEVSCEGWDGPGDPYVLKGSCGLQYRLVEIPSGLRRGEDPAYPARFSRWVHDLMQDPAALFFMLLWVAAFIFILYNLLSSCFRSRVHPDRGATPRPPPPRWPGSGWFSGGAGPHPDTHDTPPPYSKYPPSASQPRPAEAGGWSPGFWTGAALGWLGTSLMNRQARQRETEYVRAPGMYDWEAERILRPVRTAPYASSPSGSSWWGGAARRRGFDDDDRGEGPSDLGRMRRSTGLGGSNVR